MYFIKKIIYSTLVLLGVIILLFSLLELGGNDAARAAAGERADAKTIESLNKEFGLNKSPVDRLLLYIADLSPIAFHENLQLEKYSYIKIYSSEYYTLVLKFPYLRKSFQSKRSVTEIIKNCLPATMLLATAAMVFATLFGIFSGIISALNHKKKLDKFILFSSSIGISMPSFFAAVIIAWLFGFLLAEYTGLDMTGNLYEYDFVHGKYIAWKNLILPAFTLGIRPLAVITQLTRSSMLEVLQQDYIRTAVAKGLNKQQIIIHHALRNALNPVITAVSGWFASLAAGAFFVEYVFGWNGLGKVTVDALEKNDIPVVSGCILTTAVLFIVINLFADISYKIIDPRIK